jgi:ribosomal protein S17E
MVKRAAEQIMNQDNKFSPSFNENKVKLNGILPSKPIRNKVAGYIARLVRAENVQKQAVKKPVVEVVENAE